MKKQIMFGLFLIFLMVVPIAAQPDGLTSTEEGKVFLTGTVTKDITNPNDIFQGSYGSVNTFTLGDNSTGLSNFRLQNGEIGGVYGNISFEAWKAVSSAFNSSGYLDKSDWVEYDTGNIVTVTDGVYVNDDNKLSPALRFKRNSVNSDNFARFELDLSVAKSMDQYLIFGYKINTNTLNVTNVQNSFSLILEDDNGDGLALIILDYTNDWMIADPFAQWDAGNIYPTDAVYYDGYGTGYGVYQVRLSDIEALDTDVSVDNVKKIILTFGLPASYRNSGATITPWSGTFDVDIFALDFLVSPLRVGYDYNDQLTSTDDYVALNTSQDMYDASIGSYDVLRVRDLGSTISFVRDAEIDFIADVQKADTVYDDVNFRVTDEYEMKLATPVDWQNEVTLSNMKLYHVLDHSYDDYLSYYWDDNDASSKIINEVAGDVIELGTVVEDTTYRFKYQLQLSESEYDILVQADAEPLSLWSKVTLFFTSTLLIWLGFKNTGKKNARKVYTKSANKR